MIVDRCWDQKSKSQYWWYSLSCHQLLVHHDELCTECETCGGINQLIDEFDTELGFSHKYISDDDVKHPEKKAIGIIDNLINFRKSNDRVCDLLQIIRKEIIEIANGWNYTFALEQSLQTGINLAKDFFIEGGRITNLEIIENRNLDNNPIIVTLDNSGLSKDSSNSFEKQRPITTSPLSHDICISFYPSLNFLTYYSYPILFYHEIASHAFVSTIKCREFDDGWLWIALMQYLQQNIFQIEVKYQLTSRQLFSVDRYWLGLFFKKVQNAYWRAMAMKLYLKDKFLPITWDLASYPYNYNGSYDYHCHFLKIINLFDNLDKLNDLQEASQNCQSADDLLIRLEEKLGFVLA
jgi:hypothetical protein